jgi:hypothetical protein
MSVKRIDLVPLVLPNANARSYPMPDPMPNTADADLFHLGVDIIGH